MLKFGVCMFIRYTDKNENKSFLIYKEIHMDRLQSHTVYEEGLPNICGNAQIFSHTVYEEALVIYFYFYFYIDSLLIRYTDKKENKIFLIYI